MLSHKYTNGPTLEHLIDTAAAWVQYAKDKNYNVAYWQIGNEIDHHPTLMTQAEYVSAYHQMVDAMKLVDPDIQTGPRLLSNINYMRAVVNAGSDNVDFFSAHQYIWPLELDNYESWRDFTGNMIPAIDNAVTVSRENDDLPILITETNAHGYDVNSRYHSTKTIRQELTTRTHSTSETSNNSSDKLSLTTVA
ncbi:hypothetical protein QEH59_00835 [Coraliomargarita sp. SDUM461004]|uniref:Glycosyl hydrolases family 39 N-terminal catalytic domain-containing protein n=1 Tax=Thalassobacterium sedimentorum TaxID=3041258 RepID=A0ABU1ADX9_9BACT|nr:hypothetical protein [Coraliomargarita sp. SDUM461004]MDQ8192950.1 hypothetical protein [Coraliomargarita sp. SDUM461004]